MAGIDYIRVPADVLRRQDLTDKAKLLLGLIEGFNSRGLTMGNDGLAELLGTTSKTISRAISELADANLITIAGRQSRWRKIYLDKNGKVQNNSTRTSDGYTRTSDGSTFPKMSNITKETKETKDTHTPKAVSFIKPSPKEVTEYAATIGYELDGQYFVDKYTGCGWTTGKGAPMRDWRAVVRTWKANEIKDKNNGQSVSKRSGRRVVENFDQLESEYGITIEA